MPQKINKNAIELLKEVMEQRNWHQIENDKVAQRKAAQDKNLMAKGSLSYEKACFWLQKLGYKKVKEETWSK